MKELLIAKLVSKFKVSQISEAAVVQFISREVEELIKCGTIYEQNLKDLEKKIKAEVTHAREEKVEVASRKSKSVVASSHTDARSRRSAMSVAQSM